MFAIHKPTLFGLIVLAAIASPIAMAQNTSAANTNAQKQMGIDELDCRTLLRLNGDEREFTILYLHGYVSGKKGQTLLPAQQLAHETDQVIDQCIDQPAAKLLPLFEKVRGKP